MKTIHYLRALIFYAQKLFFEGNTETLETKCADKVHIALRRRTQPSNDALSRTLKHLPYFLL